MKKQEIQEGDFLFVIDEEKKAYYPCFVIYDVSSGDHIVVSPKYGYNSYLQKLFEKGSYKVMAHLGEWKIKLNYFEVNV